jgi:hypothetical protein
MAFVPAERFTHEEYCNGMYRLNRSFDLQFRSHGQLVHMFLAKGGSASNTLHLLQDGSAPAEGKAVARLENKRRVRRSGALGRTDGSIRSAWQEGLDRRAVMTQARSIHL